MFKTIATDTPPAQATKIYQMPVATLTESDEFKMDSPALRESFRSGFFKLVVESQFTKYFQVLQDFARDFKSRGYDHRFNAAHPELKASPVEQYIIGNSKPETAEEEAEMMADAENQVRRMTLARTRDYGNHWELYPPEVKEALEEMAKIARKIIRRVLEELKVPEALWEKVTGGAISENGDDFGCFNNFDASRSVRGLKAHQDWSVITVLLSLMPGLEVFIDGEWQRVQVDHPNELIINYGTTLEMLTQFLPEDLQISASKHRVIQQRDPRVSIALFADQALNSEVFALVPKERTGASAPPVAGGEVPTADGEAAPSAGDSPYELKKLFDSFLKYAAHMTRETYEGKSKY